MPAAPTTSFWVYISVGANLGDRLRNCCQAIAAVCADDRVWLEVRAPFYETEPVDYTDQEWFLNTAIKVRTTLSPLVLLDHLQAVQRAMGRRAGGVRYGPRPIDLDIILYQDCILQNERLTLPHPRLHKRRFVLQPICDIDPNVVHPTLGLDVKTLLNQIPEGYQAIRPCSFDCSSIS